MLKAFRITQYRIVLTAIEPIFMPEYSGSTLRGGFGHAFRKIVCTKGLTKCQDCMLKGVCPYSYVFETSPPGTATQLSSYKDIPRPFILDPLDTHGNYKTGESLVFRLTLIGRGIDYLPYFLVSLRELGELGIGKGRGRFQLSKVVADSGINSGEIIYSNETELVRNLDNSLVFDDICKEIDSWAEDKIAVDFLTPTRITYQGRLSDELPFHVFIQRLMGRLSTLSYFHCGESIEMDFKEFVSLANGIDIAESNLRWYDWSRYSNRQDRKMKLGGILGNIVYTGELKPFLPFIALGQYIHVGKNVTFGLGKYDIVA